MPPWHQCDAIASHKARWKCPSGAEARHGTLWSMAEQAFAPVRTRRLCLRRFRDTDAGAFAAYRSYPEVAKYQGWDAPYPLDRAETFIREMATAAIDVPGNTCRSLSPRRVTMC